MSQRRPRAASTYRGARRNAVIHPEKPEKPGVWRGIVARRLLLNERPHLNRSWKWKWIARYEDGPGRMPQMRVESHG